MSKSRGNVIDPVDVMDTYGTDGVRFGLLQSTVLGQDMSYAEDRMEGARRFCNKLWNASRFILSGPAPEPGARRADDLAARWILSRLARTQRAVDEAFEAYEFSKAASAVYTFVWSELCDWYLEMAKLSEDAEGTRAVLYQVLESALRMAHPLIPFITEEIWQRLPRGEGGPESIMVAPWPEADAAAVDDEAEREMALLQAVVAEVRRFRHDHKIPPRREIDVVVADGPVAAIVQRYAAQVGALASIGELRVGAQPPGWSRAVVGGSEVYLPLGELVDVDAERGRLEREIGEASGLAERARTKLDNPRFTEGAPAEVVAKVRSQLEEHTERVDRLRAQLEELGS